MTYQAAIASIPAGSTWSCSFGYPGEDNYSEFWRDPHNNRYELIKRNAYNNTWTIVRI
jgi:hypothetical protein